MSLLSAINYSTVEIVDNTRHSSSHRYQSQILVENRDFAPVRGPRRNIAITFGIEKLQWLATGGEKV